MRWGYFSLNATGAVAGLVVK
ncbi:TPA: hypothetical protein ACHWKV_004338, partial [Klebsiella pneumoniae]